MEEQFYQLFEQYGIYAVFALCTVEGDITLLLSGVLAHQHRFGRYSFLWVYVFGTLGGMVGDTFGYMIGRVFRETVKNYTFYKLAQPRIDRLVEKFGTFSLIVSKYIYGIRAAMCVANGVGRMPFHRFIFLDFLSCSLWVLILASVGYFFSGAVTTIIGDFKQIGIAVFFIVLGGIIAFYLIERFFLSDTIEDASPATIHKIEEKFHDLEEKLHLHVSEPPPSRGDKTDGTGKKVKDPLKKKASAAGNKP
ncbi:MAG: DedA family protein [Acidobacteriota bacterium]|nr:DedA family protein [Acidobacteriota bacterium]